MTIEVVREAGGLGIGRFVDAAGVGCSVQESSLADEPCLWLGATHLGRMHLTVAMAEALLPMVMAFAGGGAGPVDEAGEWAFEDRSGQGCVAAPIGDAARPLLRLGVERDVDGDRGVPMLLDRAGAEGLLAPLALFVEVGCLRPEARRPAH